MASTAPTPWSRNPLSELRIGVIVPPSNTTNEAEFATFGPKGVSFHMSRMPVHLESGAADYEAHVLRDLRTASALIADIDADCVAYACTAGAMLFEDGAIREQISAVTGAPAVTTGGAITDALHRLDARRIAIATPYDDALNAIEQSHFRRHGFEVTAIVGLGLDVRSSDVRLLSRIPEATVDGLVRQALAAGPADAIHISCTDLPSLAFVERLEQESGLPVVTSNQATLWAALRTAGFTSPLSCLGTLLREH